PYTAYVVVQFILSF
ncbi:MULTISPECIES: DUF3930 family protein, partial [Bacillus cereus group]